MRPQILVASSVLCCLLVVPPGSASKENEQGPQVFDLVVESYNSTDQCLGGPGDDNGIWEPGETIDLFIELGVEQLGDSGIQGTLTTDNPGVVLLQATADWPDIPGGQTAFNIEPFRLMLTVDAACFEDAGLSLALSTDQGSEGPFVIPSVVGAGFEVELPLSIPDITLGTELPMQVNDDAIIEDLDIHLVVQHTWVGDLGFTVRSPAGTEVVLLDRPGVTTSGFGCSNDDMDITFDDASDFDPEDHCPGTEPWYVGDANPVGELSDFNGESTLGTWTLIVTDMGGGDIGDLYNWELLATPVIQGPCNVCGGAGVPAVDTHGLVLLVLTLAVASGGVLARQRKRRNSPSHVSRSLRSFIFARQLHRPRRQ